MQVPATLCPQQQSTVPKSTTTNINNNIMANYQPEDQATAGHMMMMPAPGATTKRPHNTLKERIKRSMNSDTSVMRRRSSLLAAASALASLAGGESPTVADTDANTDMVDVPPVHLPPPQPTGGKATIDHHLHEERWRAATTAEEVPVTFPQKLMSVLDTEQFSDIITWLPHGKGFIILQKKKFASDVMPIYFKHSKFTSFTRKLNRWGFTRVSRGPETGSYYHKYFQRGNHSLCMQMNCQSKPTANNSPRQSPPTVATESPKLAAKPKEVPQSPSTNVAAAMSALRVETSPLALETPDLPADFETTFTRQQELLRVDQEDQRRKELEEKKKKNIGSLYNPKLFPCSNRRPRTCPTRQTKQQVEIPSTIPPMPSLAPSVSRQNNSLVSSLTSNAARRHQHPLHQSLPASFAASAPSPNFPLRNSWNNGPSNSLPTSPRAERKRPHHLQDIDWSKISNYRIQDERSEAVQNQVNLSRPFLPTPQETAMANRRQMMPPAPAPAPAYETMLNDYRTSPAGLDNASSTQHRQVIQNALEALRASNEQEYLAMLMQRQREQAQGRVLAPNMMYASQNDQGRLNAAMNTRMRQFEERNQIVGPAYPTDAEMESPLLMGSKKPEFESLCPNRVEQLQQHMKLLSSNSYIQPNPHAAPTNTPNKGKYPPGGVFRASAA
jgi:hypothetical protein